MVDNEHEDNFSKHKCSEKCLKREFCQTICLINHYFKCDLLDERCTNSLKTIYFTYKCF